MDNSENIFGKEGTQYCENHVLKWASVDCPTIFFFCEIKIV